MSDNVKDELAKVFGLADAVSWGLADDLAEAALAFLAERGMVVLGPDSEPLDVRPAVAEAGRGWCCEECAVEFYVGERDWPRYLADACIAAAEVEP